MDEDAVAEGRRSLEAALSCDEEGVAAAATEALMKIQGSLLN